MVTFLLRFSSQNVTHPGTDIHSHVTLAASPNLQRYTMLHMARNTSRPQAQWPRLVVIVSTWSHVATGLGCALRAHPLPIALACIQWTSVTTAWMMRSFSSSRTPEMSAVALDPLFRLAAKALSLLSTASTRSSSGVLASSACRSALVYVSTDPGSMTRMAVAPVLDPESVCVSLRTCCNASHASRTVGAPVGTSGPPPAPSLALPCRAGVLGPVHMATFYARRGGRLAGVVRHSFRRHPEPGVADLLETSSGPLLAAVRGPVPVFATPEAPARLGRPSFAISSRLLLGDQWSVLID